MVMRSRAGRVVIAMLLCASVATLSASSMAIAQTRGNSGLPAGSGNPMASLEAQVTALTQQVSSLSSLGQDVSTLKDQIRTLLALQAQLDTLARQATRQADELAAVGKDVTALKEQLAVLATLQRQLAALSSQVTALSNLQSQVTVLTAQVEKLAAQPANGGPALGVYDKGGQRIGDVLGVDEGVPYIGLKLGDTTVVLQVYPNQMVGLPLWFDGANCSGTGYVSNTLLNAPSVFRFGSVLEPHGVVYAADYPPPALQRVRLQSLKESNGACTNWSPFNTTALPVKPVLELDAFYERGYFVR